MVDFDSAFLWESEALRSSTPRPTRQTRHPHREAKAGATWVTLREAHQRTGIPVSTLRKWAMGGKVATYMEKTPVGEMRMVSLQGVYQRAGELGRSVTGAPPPATDAPARISPARDQAPPPQPTAEDLPPGTTLVPLDAWNKMLLQLGNLHEAGQQLAEASARAAKAETEAEFLRERLAELREELARARETPAPAPEPPSPAHRDDPASGDGSLGILRQIYTAWRRR
ncbi:MAG: hypothetical protein R3258_01760 [Acidimicrobiia bacterium]|nr:hypothetical protein [Acidimicrobiia bacterium]